ncbi:flagellin [Pseudoteredinibacter isoporae]|uniref:Flagellin n=1 Tax=Pseudoteredinibacter isoporae TaxID=570281 RepID=A0A7X0MXR4_9GAMM|nr:flagellin [Pseudoteredinibacter isoporae]MBB6523485.1 flagellin [Pseudoteredinibacter isoporae]NHO88994.1 flagellin [Pseudoteredinibacter isoporae]NIB24298.1 flagellin [Pseudoteredinibacter isoporae]
MASVINTNMASLTAQRNLSSAQGAQADAMQRLSSGLRINSAKDDAAGLAISTRFSSQTQGLAVAIRNSGDGISLAQTAEGALGTMTESLQRVRELALQAANGTNSASDREALNAEAQQMIAEITRTAKETNFNGQKLLDGTFDTKFQVGANGGETIDVQVSDLSVDKLGVSDQAGVSAVGTDSALGNGDLIINGVSISTSSAADDDASTDNAGASAIAKAAAINKHTDETGVRAVVDENNVAGSVQTAGAITGQSLTLNGVSIQVDTTGDAATTRAAVASAINAVSEQTGVKAVDTEDAATGVTLQAADGRNIELDFGAGGLTAANTGLAAGGTYEGGFTLIAEGDTKTIDIDGGNGTGNGDIANAGLAKGEYTPGVSAVSASAKTGDVGTAATAATGTIDLSNFLADNSGGGPHTVVVTVDGTDQTWTFDADLSGAGADNDDIIADLAGQSGITLTAVNGGAAQDGLFTITSSSTGATSTLATGATAGNGAGTAITGYTAGADLVGPSDRDLDAGDLVINNVAIKAAQAGDDTASYADAASSSKQASGISIAAAINKSTSETGVSAEVNATEFVGGSSTTAPAAAGSAGGVGNTGAVWVNGVEVSLTVQADAGSSRAHALEQINKVSGQTGVTAADNGESLTLTAADGRNIVLAFDTNDTTPADGVTAAHFGLGGSDISSSDLASKTDADAAAVTTYSTVTLTGAGDIEVGAGINGSTALDELGFTAGNFGGGEDGTFLKDIDLTTVDGANAALTAIDNALDTVNAQRADLGAIQNRFETTVKNLQVNAENLTASNSRIRDADFAAETAELSRARVLQQAGTSILAQANALPNQVLSLLQ